MTKSNRVLLVALTLITSLMIGYALFSDTVTVSGTATAKGDFSISRTCAPGIDNNILTYLGLEDAKEGGYRNDSCQVVGNSFSTNVGLDFPTAGRWFTITLTNTGTIPAYLYLDDLYENFTVCKKEDGVETCTDAIKEKNEDVYDFIKKYYYFALPIAKNKQGEYFYYDIDDEMYDSEKNAYKIENGESIVLPLYQYWQMENPPYGQSANYGDFVTTVNVELNLVQETY